VTETRPVTETLGPRLFARYAYAPNSLGYCGPADAAALFELAATGRTSADITAIAARFTGAWPYLTVLAELTGIGDPLDERVVRGYWTGGPLLDTVDRAAFGTSLIERIRAAGAGRYWAHLTAGLLPEAAPTHAFHVFGVYPWSRLLTAGQPEHPLHVLDSCRIRWGRIVSVHGDRAVVCASRLTWDSRQLGLGPERDEAVRLTEGGRGFVARPRPGEWVALHWDWVCDRLTDTDVGYLRQCTHWQLTATNTRLAADVAGAGR
jgi:Family of unknown function (DUF6390)